MSGRFSTFQFVPATTSSSLTVHSVPPNSTSYMPGAAMWSRRNQAFLVSPVSPFLTQMSLSRLTTSPRGNSGSLLPNRWSVIKRARQKQWIVELYAYPTQMKMARDAAPVKTKRLKLLCGAIKRFSAVNMLCSLIPISVHAHGAGLLYSQCRSRRHQRNHPRDVSAPPRSPHRSQRPTRRKRPAFGRPAPRFATG